MTNTPSQVAVPVVAALIEREGKILIAQRPPKTWMDGYWEFPGGKLNAGEDPREALARELREELGVQAEVGDLEEAVAHSYSDRNVLLLFYWCRILEGEPQGLEGQALRWVSPQDLGAVEILPADLPIVKRLQASR